MYFIDGFVSIVFFKRAQYLPSFCYSIVVHIWCGLSGRYFLLQGAGKIYNEGYHVRARESERVTTLEATTRHVRAKFISTRSFQFQNCLFHWSIALVVLQTFSILRICCFKIFFLLSEMKIRIYIVYDQ